MGVVHHFQGVWGESFEWGGGRTHAYQTASPARASETWLIGMAERAENFALRYYELETGGQSRAEQHPHDHGLFFLRGKGSVRLSDEIHEVGRGDVVYIPPEEPHQVVNSADEPLGWLCIIPARRRKGDRVLWAEEGQQDLTLT